VFEVLEPSVVETGISEAEVERLIAERNRVRKAKDFARADEIRRELLEKGVILEDTREGARWKRKVT
jgi:cysteinyl-tRNA synthetase